MTSDTAAAKEFYAQLFGWDMEDQPISGTTYTVVKAAGQAIGGLMNPPDRGTIPPHWGVYVTVDDVDASVQRVEELGGQVKVPPTDVPDVGRFAVIQDPQGAFVSMITYTQPT